MRNLRHRICVFQIGRPGTGIFWVASYLLGCVYCRLLGKLQGLVRVIIACRSKVYHFGNGVYSESQHNIKIRRILFNHTIYSTQIIIKTKQHSQTQMQSLQLNTSSQSGKLIAGINTAADFSDSVNNNEENQSLSVEQRRLALAAIKEYNMDIFDLRDLEGSQHIGRDAKFTQLFEMLKHYNQKLLQKRQTDILNYKYNAFIYSELSICLNKTQKQVSVQMRHLAQWIKMYTHRRQFIIIPKRKNKPKNNEEEDAIRQTYRSTLPQEIQQYTRKLWLGNERGSFKVGKSTSMEKKQSKYSDLPKEPLDLRLYRMEVLRLRKINQQKQLQSMIEEMKKNQTRIKAQTSSNFYKNKASKFILGRNMTTMEDSKLQETVDGPSFSLPVEKQNARIIASQTSANFNKIKKNKLQKLLTKTSYSQMFRKTFNNSSAMGNSKILSELSQTQRAPFKQVQSIEGCGLMKNPFQILRPKAKHPKP